LIDFIKTAVMLKGLRRRLDTNNAGFSACGCCTIGFIVIASVFSSLVLPEYQMINSFQQDSCMMYDCGGEMRLFLSFDCWFVQS
jgi:hypothetical protein